MRSHEVAEAIRRIRSRMQEAEETDEVSPDSKLKGRLIIHSQSGDVEASSPQQAVTALKDLLERGQIPIFIAYKKDKALVKKYNKFLERTQS